MTILLGHTTIKNTVRYLGINVEEDLILAEHTEICSSKQLSGIARWPILRAVKPPRTDDD